MKTLWLVLLSLCLTPLFGQMRERSWSLSAAGSFSNNESEYKYLDYFTDTLQQSNHFKYKALRFQAGIHYFFKRYQSLGLESGIYYSENKSHRIDYHTQLNNSEFTIISRSIPLRLVYSRYHPINRKFILQSQFAISTHISQNVENVSNTEFSGNSYSANLNLGFTWLPGQKLGLNLSLGGIGWNYFKFKNAISVGDTKIKGTGSFNLDLNPSNIYLSLNYFFNQ